MKGRKGKLCVALGLSAVLAGCGGYDNTPAASSPAYLVAEGAAQTDYRPVVQQLYIAYFGRPADPQGEASFASALAALNAPADIGLLSKAYGTDAGIRNLVDAFGTSAESIALYGAGDTTSFVSVIYNNVLARAPKPEGLAFWAEAIDGGGLTKGGAALAIVAGALANETVQGQADAALILRRLEAASYFTTALRDQNKTASYTGPQAAAIARASLATVDATASATAYRETMGSLIVKLTDVFTSGTPDSSGAVTLADCFGNDVLMTPGTVYETAYDVMLDSGATVRSDAYVSTVNGPVSFYGLPLIETETTATIGAVATARWKDYSEKSGQEILAYGSIDSHDAPAGCPAGADTYRYLPAFRTPLSLKPGESLTQSYDSYFQRDCDAAITTKAMTKITFVKVETVTVPAGTFEACKIRVEGGDPALPDSFSYHHYAWHVKGGRYKSLQIKYAEPDEVDPLLFSQATKLSVNGI